MNKFDITLKVDGLMSVAVSDWAWALAAQGPIKAALLLETQASYDELDGYDVVAEMNIGEMVCQLIEELGEAAAILQQLDRTAAKCAFWADVQDVLGAGSKLLLEVEIARVKLVRS